MTLHRTAAQQFSLMDSLTIPVQITQQIQIQVFVVFSTFTFKEWKTCVFFAESETSITVSPLPKCKVELYTECKYLGTKHVYQEDTIRVKSEKAYSSIKLLDCDYSIVQLFGGPSFSGMRRDATFDVPCLTSQNFDKKITSLKIGKLRNCLFFCTGPVLFLSIQSQKTMKLMLWKQQGIMYSSEPKHPGMEH